MHRRREPSFPAATVLLLMVLASPSLAQERHVHSIRLDGAITPSSADYLHEEIRFAFESGAECLIVHVNTPGGLLKSTRVMVSDILESQIPIIIYVSPPGSQAASAGVFITLAAHFAVMAPGTNIGAAHPVSIGQESDSIMIEKATNDAAAFIRTISEKRHRNVAWAEDAVRKSLSITETEALRAGIIDTISPTAISLMEYLDGKETETSLGTKVLRTRSAKIVDRESSAQRKILDILSDPNLAYLLMMLGFYGILFELYNPGSIFPGVVGFIALILSFYSLHTLPVNYAGVALIVFGLILLALEVKIVSHGLLGIGGTISILLGSIMLIRVESTLDVIQISWEVILLSMAVTLMFFFVVLGVGIRAQRLKPSGGSEGIVDEIGIALTDLTPQGQVRVHGEIWSAISSEGHLPSGSAVKVISLHNLTLTVRKHLT